MEDTLYYIRYNIYSKGEIKGLLLTTWLNYIYPDKGEYSNVYLQG